jgi:hypothetical protein
MQITSTDVPICRAPEWVANSDRSKNPRLTVAVPVAVLVNVAGSVESVAHLERSKFLCVAVVL